MSAKYVHRVFSYPHVLSLTYAHTDIFTHETDRQTSRPLVGDTLPIPHPLDVFGVSFSPTSAPLFNVTSPNHFCIWSCKLVSKACTLRYCYKGYETMLVDSDIAKS